MDIKIGNFVFYEAEVTNIRANHFPVLDEFNIVIDDSMAFRFKSLSEMNLFIKNLKKLVNE